MPQANQQDPEPVSAEIDVAQLADQIRQWGRELGFQAVGISEGKVPEQDQQHFKEWLAHGVQW